MLERICALAARRPQVTLAAVVALALAGGAAALRLSPSTGIQTFVGSSSRAARTTAAQQRRFGTDPVVVLVSEPLGAMLAPASLATLARLEACLAGQYVAFSSSLGAYVPIAHAPYGGYGSPCAELRRSRAAQVVYGPASFLNRAVAAVNSQIRALVVGAARAVDVAERTALSLSLARGLGRRQALREAAAAGAAERARQLAGLERLALSSGLRGTPSIEDPTFVRQLVLNPSPGPATPRPRLSYVFPSPDAALIQVRLRATLTGSQRSRAIAWIGRALRMPGLRLPGATYTLAGEQVVLDGVAGRLGGSLATLLIAAVIAMALTLLIVFRAPLRLLALGVALASAGISFGLLALLGAGLTVASIAVLPILIGLAVDYAVQLQARVQEDAGAGRASVADAAGRAAPSIATAALATTTGFLVLLLSPVPMVRGFGLLLVAGIAVAFGCALAVVPAALSLRGMDSKRRRAADRPAVAPAALSLRGDPAPRNGSPRRLGALVGPSLLGARDLLSVAGRGAWGLLAVAGRGAWALLDASARGAWELLAPSVRGARALVLAGVRLAPSPGEARTARRAGARHALASRMADRLLAHPGRVLAVGAALAALGWVADGRTAVQTDLTRLVGSGTPVLRALSRLERVSGVSGEIDVLVTGRDVTTPALVAWMSDYESRVLRHFGYLQGVGCAHATLCPAISLPGLLSGSGAGKTTRASIDALLREVPAYFTRAVVTPDHRAATLAFGIRLMPLARQQRVISYLSSQLHPPRGVSAGLAGLPVLAARAGAVLSSGGRRLLTLLVALLAVGAVLLAVLRSPRRALVPMAPIVLATGWSSLIVKLTGIPLNPMSATLGTLVIAITTEFSVLLSERHRQERRAGHDLRAALSRAYRSTGAAVLVSGLTAIVGFAVLVVSGIPMLRDFGLVTLVDLSVSLAGVLLVLPAALAASERGARGRLGAATLTGPERHGGRTRVA